MKPERAKVLKTVGIGSSVLWFAAAMDAELRANTHKHGWGTMEPHQLLQRLRQETEELVAALARGKPEEIVSEAADVANFAMMIADVSTPQPWDDE